MAAQLKQTISETVIANDESVVHNSGMETISGAKVFIDHIQVGNSLNSISVYDNRVSRLTDGSPEYFYFPSDGGTLATEDYVDNRAYDLSPAMDGTASAGSASAYARGDHVHPTDTSRASQSDMDSLVSGLDDAIQLLDGWNGVFAESWTLTMDDGTTQTRVVLNQQEESNG